MAFPINPINNQTAVVNGILYTYNSTKAVWSVSTNSGIDYNVNSVNASALVTAGNIKTTNGVFWSNGAPFGGSPSGSTTNVQYNSSNQFAGASNFTYTAASGNVVIGTTTVSTSSTTGALVVGGGVGVAGNVFLNTTSAINFYAAGYFVRASTGLELQSVDLIRLSTGGGNERFRIDAGGNVGIGTTTPSQRLHVVGGTISQYKATGDNGGLLLGVGDTSNSYIRLSNSYSTTDYGQGNGAAFVNVNGTQPWYVATGGAERVRIDASGNVGIGSTSVAGKLQVVAGSVAELIIGYNATSFNYYDADTQIFRSAGKAERMRISAAGGLSVGTTTDPGVGAILASGAITAGGIVTASTAGFQSATYTTGARNRIWSFGNADGFGLSYFQGTAGMASADTIGFHFGTATSAASQFQFTQNGHLYATGDIYSSYSDINLKTIVGRIEDPISLLKQIEVFYYEPNETAISLGAIPGRKVGVSAQSVLKVQSEAVGKSTLGTDYLTVQYERLVPLLIETAKQQQETIEQLIAKINDLQQKLGVQ